MLFGAPAKLQDGRYFLKITSDDGSRVIHQVNGVTMSGQVTLHVPAHKDFFAGIDEVILTQAKASKVEWFGKEISDETVTSAYQKSVNPEGELSASFATIKGQVVTTAYDTQKNPVDVTTIEATTPVDVFLELVGLVFTKRAFEPVWKLIQVRVKGQPKSRFPREYMFADEEEEEDLDL